MPLFFHPLIVRSGAGLPERWSGYWDISAETGSALHIYGDRRYSAILDLYANRVRHRSPGGTLLLLDSYLSAFVRARRLCLLVHVERLFVVHLCVLLPPCTIQAIRQFQGCCVCDIPIHSSSSQSIQSWLVEPPFSHAYEMSSYSEELEYG